MPALVRFPQNGFRLAVGGGGHANGKSSGIEGANKLDRPLGTHKDSGNPQGEMKRSSERRKIPKKKAEDKEKHGK